MRRFRRHLALSVVPTIMSSFQRKITRRTNTLSVSRSTDVRISRRTDEGRGEDDEIHWRALELRKIMEHRGRRKEEEEHDEANERSALRREMHFSR